MRDEQKPPKVLPKADTGSTSPKTEKHKPAQLTSGSAAIVRIFAKDAFFAYLCVVIAGFFAVGAKLLVKFLEKFGFDDSIVLTGLNFLFYFIFVVDVLVAMLVTVLLALKLVREIWK